MMNVEQTTQSQPQGRAQKSSKGLVVAIIVVASILLFILSVALGAWVYRTFTGDFGGKDNEGVGLYPYTSEVLLSYGDLEGMSLAELKIMRNEIYARNGYIFSTKDMKQYFAAQSWYVPQSRNVALSSIEQQNIATISQYEKLLSSSPRSSRSRGGSSGLMVGRYPNTSTRELVYDDLAGLSNWELRIMRNEIYARHGYIFKSKDMRDYFAKQSWYRPTTSNVKLSAIEQKNVNYIQSFEK